MTTAPARPGAGQMAGAPTSLAALSGVLAAAAAVGLAETVAAVVPAVASPVVVVGDRVVDLAPPALKDFAVAVFSTADKAALLIGIVVVCAGAGAALGVLTRRRRSVAAVGFAGFAALGAWAVAAGEEAGVAVATALTLLVAAAFGVALLWGLLGAWPRPAGARAGGSDAADTAPGEAPRAARAPRWRSPSDPVAFDRRRFFRLAAGAGLVAATGAVSGRLSAGTSAVEEVRETLALPAAARPLPPAPAGASLRVPGLSPLYVPNTDFYRIDTALAIPQVAPSEWSLDVTGLVDRPFRVSYDDLLDMELEEGDITLACVSNEVGGRLVGNARWLGVPLAALLERAGVQPDGTQLVGRSVDGFTVGFPTEVALDGRQAMVAVGMNGEPLPAEHGFPARLVVPGLFGYVSATKWLAEIELVPWDAFDAYWVPRGWDKLGPVLTQSRIDVPSTGGSVAAGTVQVAGVAWQPAHGIDRVEVAVDGEWHGAELADELADSAWRQWRFAWEATEGRHELMVRATDGTGVVQSSARMGPRPFGATGFHTISVNVTA